MDESAVRMQYGIGNEDWTCLFIGRMVRDKGVVEMVNTVVRLHKEGFPVKLLLVGGREDNLDGEDYYEVNDIPDSSNVDMRRLYDNYFVIRTPNQNAKMKELVLSRNDSMENIVNKIKSLMERNTIQIRINC